MTQEYTKSASASGMSAYELGIGRKSQADLLSYSRKTARKHIQISVQKNIAKEYVRDLNIFAAYLMIRRISEDQKNRNRK